MTTPIAIDWPHNECESCGASPVTVYATTGKESAEKGLVHDGDAVECPACGAKGGICCDSESAASVTWCDDEDAGKEEV